MTVPFKGQEGTLSFLEAVDMVERTLREGRRREDLDHNAKEYRSGESNKALSLAWNNASFEQRWAGFVMMASARMLLEVEAEAEEE